MILEKNLVKKAIIVFVMVQVFAPRDMKIVGCYTDYMKCVAMTNEEKKNQSEPLKKLK